VAHLHLPAVGANAAVSWSSSPPVPSARSVRAAILVGLALLLLAPGAQAVPELDQPAPALKGTLFSGAAFDLEQMKGKVVLVNFYSSYCKFCAYEIGNLETFYEQHHGEGFDVIALGVDELADRGRVARMLGIYNLPGTMVDELRANGFGRRYPTPTTFLIDRNGVLRYKRWGAKTPEFYREVVLPLLREQ
jgi:cytochrome c biogenesis protein CcmG/thiol:disulfide interchange protein DsbE